MRFEFELMVEEAKFIEENWMKMCRLLLTKVEGKDIDEDQPLSEGDQLMAFNVLDKKLDLLMCSPSSALFSSVMRLVLIHHKHNMHTNTNKCS